MKKLLLLTLCLLMSLSLCMGFACADEGGELPIDWRPDSLGDDPDAPEYSNVYLDPVEAYAAEHPEEYAEAMAELERQLAEEGIELDEAERKAYLAEMLPMEVSDGGAKNDSALSLLKENEAGANEKSSHYYTAAAMDVPVLNQGTRSICWSVAAMDCLRIGEAKAGRSVPTLDAEQLVSYTYNGFTDSLALTKRDYITPIDAQGRGNVYASLMTLASGVGTGKNIQADSSGKYPEAYDYANTQLWLEDGYWFTFEGTNDREAVKKAIVEYGAVAASMISTESGSGKLLSSINSTRCYNADTNAYYYDTTPGDATTTDHEIVIVGWDDDYSAANFNAENQPEINGAWLCRNTWGEGFGDNGYFWISYADQGMTKRGMAVCFGAAPSTDGINLYQHDGNYTFYSLETVEAKTVTVANVFTAADSSGHDRLCSVGTYATAAGTQYTVEVYVGLTDNADPTSGTRLATASGTFPYAGYQTVALDTKPYIDKGESFSVVYTLTAPGDSSTITLPICRTLDYAGSFKAYNWSAAGQSFLLSGDEWQDRSATKAADDYTGINYRIKAITCGDTDEGHTHAWQEKDVLTAAGCTEDGLATVTCSCGVIDTKSLPAGHTLTHHEALAATTTKPGNTEYWQCSACEKCFSDQNGKTEIKLSDTVRPTKGFDDVASTRTYYNEVMWAVNQGITDGMGNGQFRPYMDCLRAQIVTFLWRAEGEPEPTVTTCPFTDVRPGDYFYKAVLWAVEKGITNGMTDTLFGPYEECTRGQIVTFLWRAKGKPTPTSTSDSFTDLTRSYYREAIRWAAETEVAKGVTATTFVPESTCQRWHAVLFLYRAYASDK